MKLTSSKGKFAVISLINFLKTSVLLAIRWNFKMLAKRKRPTIYQNYIISLTSYPLRYPYLYKTLKSLLLQSATPEQIHVFVFENEYDMLDQKFFKLAPDRIKYLKWPKNLKVYLKLIPAQKSYKEKYITVCDDDIYYTKNWFKELVMESLSNPRCAIGHRGITKQITDFLNIPFSEWPEERTKTNPSTNIILTGVGGIVYPPKSLFPMFDDDQIYTKLAPTSDDLWFHYMLNLKGTASVALGREFQPRYWPNSQSRALWKTNVSMGENDLALRRLEEEFGRDISW
jgi:hypothetical protein